jgi:hypothetical protein
MRSSFTLLIVASVALAGTRVQTQQRGGTPQTDQVPPVNTGANPYRVIRDWAQLTIEARPWGGSNGVAVDRDGKSVWATDRCSPGTAPGCLGTGQTVHFFDDSGKDQGFGGGMFV